MTFIYSDTEKSVQPRYPVPYDRLDATKHYLTHLGNYMYLKFILENTDKWQERHQANKEIVICNRKLEYWRRHPNCDMRKVEEGKKVLERQWASKR